jgi:hypothetical protein
MIRIRKAATGMIVLLSALALGGCMTDGYGRAGVSIGSGHYDRYGYDYPYSGYGYGWYDGYYYPGSGYYVFDRYGKRHRWSQWQRDYWAHRGHDRRHGYDRDRDRRDWNKDRNRDRNWSRDRERSRNNWKDRGDLQKGYRDHPRYDRNRGPNLTRPDRDGRGSNHGSERRPERRDRR